MHGFLCVAKGRQHVAMGTQCGGRPTPTLDTQGHPSVLYSTWHLAKEERMKVGPVVGSTDPTSGGPSAQYFIARCPQVFIYYY